MKLLLAAFIFCTSSVFAHEVIVKTPKEGNERIYIYEEEPVELILPVDDIEPGEPCEIPEVQPVFKEGDEYGILYIAENIKYPDSMREMNIQGRVFVSFIVEIDGSITNVKVLKGIDKELDREAKRVVHEMPNWIPGECRTGVPARCVMRLPIKFAIEE